MYRFYKLNIMKKLSFLLLVLFVLFSGSVSAKDKEQDFSQTKISWDGPPEYEFKILECEGSTYTSIVYIKFAITHNLAHQYVELRGRNAYDRSGKNYYVNLFGYSSVGGYSFRSNIDRILKTDTESIVEAKVELNGKIENFDSVKLEFYIKKPYYNNGTYKLEFINLPIEWKFLNF